VGKPLLRICFLLVDKVICGGERVAEVVASLGCSSHKCSVMPPLVSWPASASDTSILDEFLRDKQVVISLFVSQQSSFLRREGARLASLLCRHVAGKVGVVIVPTSGGDSNLGGGILSPQKAFILKSPSLEMVKYLVSRSTIVLRPLRCAGKEFMPDYGFMLERPRRLGAFFDTGVGLAIVRKDSLISEFVGVKETSTISTEVNKVVEELLSRRKITRVLLIGAFPLPIYEETSFNEAIRLGLEKAGVSCETIKLPQESFDSEKTSSFVSFVKSLNQRIRKNDAVLYMTQGYTRPSLLLLLSCAGLGRLWRKCVYVLFHRDLFAFFTHLRSRNAGLPLLFTSFTLVEGIFATDEGCRTAGQYKNTPQKFHNVTLTVPAFNLIPTAQTHSNHAFHCPALGAKRDAFYAEVARGIQVLSSSLRDSGQLLSLHLFSESPKNGFGAHPRRPRRTGAASSRDERSPATSVCGGAASKHDKDSASARESFSERVGYQSVHYSVRPLFCNGETVMENQAALIETSRVDGEQFSCPSGVIMIRKDATRFTDLVMAQPITQDFSTVYSDIPYLCDRQHER
jgi:hypothetical protein